MNFPPNRNEYFGTWLCSLLMGLKLHCGYVICYLVGNIIVHTQPSSLALAYLTLSFLQGFGNVTAYHHTVPSIYIYIYRYVIGMFLAGSWPDNKE